MSEFEKYLQEQKSNLDSIEADPKIWTSIQKEIAKIPSKKKLGGNRKIYLWPLILFLLSAVGFGFWKTQLDTAKQEIPQELLIAAGFKSSDQIENLLEKKTILIKNTPVSTEYKNQLQLLLDQVQYLDKLYESTFQYLEISEYPGDKAKSRMDYYKAKSEILDKVLFEIEKINKNEKEFNIDSEKSPLIF